MSKRSNFNAINIMLSMFIVPVILFLWMTVIGIGNFSEEQWTSASVMAGASFFVLLPRWNV